MEFQDAVLNMAAPTRTGRTSGSRRPKPGRSAGQSGRREDRPAGTDRLTCRQLPAKVAGGVQAIVLEAALAAMVWGGRLRGECQFRSVKVLFSFSLGSWCSAVKMAAGIFRVNRACDGSAREGMATMRKSFLCRQFCD